MAEPQEKQIAVRREMAVLAIYLAVGAACGFVVGTIAATGASACTELLHSGLTRRETSTVLWTSIDAGALAGGFAGFTLATPMWLVAGIWPRARHPVSAGALCGSVSGSVWTLFTVWFIDDHVLAWLAISCALVAGFAAYGFLVTLVARHLARGWLTGSLPPTA
jgi:hypothetical protein